MQFTTEVPRSASKRSKPPASERATRFRNLHYWIAYFVRAFVPVARAITSRWKEQDLQERREGKIR